ncbi:hypothetical protein E2C01_025105 [Portunus trituberculatus]|uniref:Uncharacterized protein n=1 Tax=Portunus trituberculatus TaxID=210409 RepID=A0A5B7EE71_PORTR|nr:hypothetical protein [Portunus trituberculatus]
MAVYKEDSHTKAPTAHTGPSPLPLHNETVPYPAPPTLTPQQGPTAHIDPFLPLHTVTPQVG